MHRFKEPRIILIFILSLTLIGAEINNLFPQSIRSRVNAGEPVHILVLGIDARPGEDMTRSDAIVLASIHKKLGKALLLSVPRDTKVIYKGKTQKINMLSQLYGPEVTCKEVSRLLGVEVDHYILTNFSGFENVIDTLGGVYIDVDINLRWYSCNVFLEKGPQQLNGKEALAYARFRGGSDADIGRTQRQQKLIKAILKQLMKKENLSKLPAVIAQLYKNVESNLSINDMIYLANLTTQIDTDNIITQTLPGYHYWCPYSGASYWEVDRDIALSIINSLYNGHKYEVIEEKPPWGRGY